jgi:hypothetical protein
MNYGEEIAYWYLRLNGFFPITNFVIHRSSEIEHSADCDLLAIRLPFVYEEIGGNPDDWDEELSKEFGFDHTIGVICEVKTGAYDLGDIFRPEYVKYAIGRLGFTQRENVAAISEALNKVGMLEIEEGRRICKLLIANDQKESPGFIFRSLNSVEDFINDRVRKYPKEKYADRMYFGSELFQHTIHLIHREKDQQKLAKRGRKSM